mgnify:CR=1 FL=1
MKVSVYIALAVAALLELFQQSTQSCQHTISILVRS